MTELQFFPRPRGLTAQEIADISGAVPHPGAPLDRRITGLATLDRAGPADLVFLQNQKLVPELGATRAGICLTTARYADKVPPGTAVLVTREPYQAFVAAAGALYPDAMRPSSMIGTAGISPSALIDPTARLESGVVVDPGAVIGPRAEVGTGTLIGPSAVIGPDVRIGRDCAIGADATIIHSLIGDRVIIHPGARIGQDGFGFLRDARGYRKIPQVSRVIIQNDVEIGASTAIDRGAIRDTVIGEGTKIDNLVQIGHNTEVGRHCVMAAFTGISGSVTVGDYVKMGGRVGITDNLTIGEGATLIAMASIICDIPAGETWGGYPARPWREWLRSVAVTEKLARAGAGGKHSDEEALK